MSFPVIRPEDGWAADVRRFAAGVLAALPPEPPDAVAAGNAACGVHPPKHSRHGGGLIDLDRWREPSEDRWTNEHLRAAWLAYVTSPRDASGRRRVAPEVRAAALGYARIVKRRARARGAA